MGFYDNSKEERVRISNHIESLVYQDYEDGSFDNIIKYSSDEDTYIRKIIYVTIGKLYKNNEKLREQIINCLDTLLKSEIVYIRQTITYSLKKVVSRR